MKLSRIFLLTTASLFLAACNSLDNPITNLFHGMGHDERVYNPQTGQWEWPDKKRSHEKKSAAVASALDANATPATAHGFNDTRYWDAQRNQWVEAPEERTPSAPKPKPTPAAPATAGIAATSTAPAVPPPPPRPARATGVYNSSTGKIDWNGTPEYGAPPATPAPKKHWYWPF